MDNQAVDAYDLNTRGASPRLPARRLVMPIIALALDFVPALIVLLSLLYYVPGMFVGGFILLLAGIILGVLFLIQKRKGAGIAAVVLLSVALIFLIAGSISRGAVGVALFMLFLAVMSPIVGIVLGIISFTMGKKRIGRAGRVIAAIAAALPVLVVGIIILLVQTGAMVISFM